MRLFFNRMGSLTLTPVHKTNLRMRILLFFLFSFWCTCSYSQKINENTVVKDSSGTVYPYAAWLSMLRTGDYVLKQEKANDPNTAFVLTRLTEEEKEARLAKMPPTRESSYFKKGAKFSLGKLTDVQGIKIDLKNNAGKITVVNFWFINCQPCRMEMPELNKLVEKYASDSVRFVAVALDEKSEIENFLKLFPFKYSIVDGGRYLAEGQGVRSYPTHVVVDKEGKVYFHTTGLSTNTVYWIEKSIKELLAKANATAGMQ